MESLPHYSSFEIYSRAARYYRQFAWPILGACGLVLVKIGVELLRPWPLKAIIDDYLTPHRADVGAIAWLCVALVGIALVAGALHMLSTYLQVKIGLKALVQTRRDLYAQLQELSLKYHDKRHSGDSVYRVSYDAGAIQTIYNRGFSTIFTAAVTLIGILAVMFWKSWPLTLLALAITPVLLGSIYYFADRIRRETTALSESESRLLTQTQEGLGTIRIVRAFGREGYEVNRFEELASLSMLANLKLTFTQVLSALVVGVLMAVGISAMTFVGATQVLAGKLTLGDLTMFLAYLYMLYEPLQQLSYTSWALEGAAAGAQRVFEVLDSPEVLRDRPGAVELPPGQGAIGLSGVQFGYDPAKPVLHDVNLEIRPGEMVAVVGPTGSGKSTLLSLIARFYDPDSGKVTIDGRDLREVKRDSLRRRIGMVLQDTVLLSSTIRENIAYGDLRAGADEILRAAERAQAIAFIDPLPQGFETNAGERGVQLSVGQRQRIGIARAFLKNAPILLLDEPTSSLDPETERELLTALRELMKGRTTVMATHRIAAAHACDRIVVLEGGRIVESGRGEDLLAKNGVYARIHASQIQER
jgi:ATP-binding cassette subfamily B protein/subfamily B ATP-binding cassette protein MsbA